MYSYCQRRSFHFGTSNHTNHAHGKSVLCNTIYLKEPYVNNGMKLLCPVSWDIIWTDTSCSMSSLQNQITSNNWKAVRHFKIGYKYYLCLRRLTFTLFSHIDVVWQIINNRVQLFNQQSMCYKPFLYIKH